ncbi:S-adenosyl-L-methionine-dependent methyltransferase [Coniella lustricola]|uniref:tRNA (adenine(58)-N(1))-methyltransferase catalytic subunit TRM61 n=1 Tax=Coniella lustricola TaxID=2025994 RepID=A0A2T2ZZG4_9PEZI|nr:S-adenosyl-L-methionine-dependent methyltransferase [Coniella lustricola]
MASATPPPTNPGDSPFLRPGSITRANTLAIIQLAKDDLVPVYLRESQGEHDGYKEGHVLNTRFGSFPHHTLIGVPWGSQVRASNVDTGSRGRRKKSQRPQAARNDKTMDEDEDVPTPAEIGGDKTNDQQVEAQDASAGLKRKRDASDEAQNATSSSPNKQRKSNNSTTAAASGFVHILPPTPEIWTSSLPHRTQVVYTPDYSYVLQRIRARPGTRLIEAGSGSGSFTHASARAVYDGSNSSTSTGKVFSFEFHEQRFGKMKKELQEHGLTGLVEVNHRDVYNEGFLIDGKSPEADAIFLDLPAPWLALPHLSRRRPATTTPTNPNAAKTKTGSDVDSVAVAGEGNNADSKDEWVSPLNPRKSAYICTFSPCIEQVTRTVSEMRKLGWVDIEMVVVAHKRIQVFREKIGLNIVSERGMQQAPKDVTEALAKLKEIEGKAAEHNAKMTAQHANRKGTAGAGQEDLDDEDDDVDAPARKPRFTKQNRDESFAAAQPKDTKPSFMQGQLVTRSESEIKAHTSYLVFAILPREWSDEDEAAAAAKWPVSKEPLKVIGTMDRAARKQAKREQMQGARQKNQKVKEDGRAQGKAKAAATTAAASGGGGGDAAAAAAAAAERQNADVEMAGAAFAR